MNVPFSGISRQLSIEKKQILDIFSSVIDSGMLLFGPNEVKFEKLFRDNLGCESVLFTNNGTSSLEQIMKFLRSQGMERVGVVANAGGYASLASLSAGFEVFLIDSDETSALMSTTSLLKSIERERLEVIVYTHLYGNLHNFDKILDICNAYDIILVEDCAQAYGLKYKNKFVGTFGKFSAFSFYPSKNLGALGDAGAIVCKDIDDFSKLKSLTQYGWASRYHVINPGGTNSRIDELQSAILLWRLSKIDDWNFMRKQIVLRYSQVIHPSWGRFLDFTETVGHLAVLVTENRELHSELLDQKRIGHAIHYPVPDNKQLAWLRYYSNQSCSIAELLCDRVLSLPCHPYLSEDEINYVCEIISEKAI